MLTIVINTKFLKYKKVYIPTEEGRQKADVVCTRQELAICHFLNDHKDPLCNVPLQCFDSNYFVVNPPQYLFFREAMNIVRVYHEHVPECLLYEIPLQVFNTIAAFVPIRAYIPEELLPDDSCYRNNLIELVPPPESQNSHPQMKQLENSPANNYAIEHIQGTSTPGELVEYRGEDL